MPMPEMTKSIKRWFMDIGDDLPYTVGGFKAEVEEDRQACYAAGKADALPPWPPEDGAEFKWGNRESIFKFKFGRWSCSRLPQHEYEPFFILDIREQVALTVAWFKGELEEVK